MLGIAVFCCFSYPCCDKTKVVLELLASVELVLSVWFTSVYLPVGVVMMGFGFLVFFNECLAWIMFHHVEINYEYNCDFVLLGLLSKPVVQSN